MADNEKVIGEIDSEEYERLKDNDYFYNKYEELTGINIFDYVSKKLLSDPSKV